MFSPPMRFRRQKGAANTLLYIALTGLVAVAVALTLYLLTGEQEPSSSQAEATPEVPQLNAEPPPIQTVDMQEAKPETWPPARPRQPTPASPSTPAPGMFNRPGRKIPLTDGLAGGSEAVKPATRTNLETAPRSTANAVDSFDFAVLDGRVRIGVFGKTAISDYRAQVSKARYVIEMPGEYRYVEEFSKALTIRSFGVSSAQLMRTPRGMRLVIDITPDLRHQPFLIEDPHGLMVAFEPR